MSLRVLVVTNMYPRPEAPVRGVFLARQLAHVNPLLTDPVEIVLVGRTGAGGLSASRRAVASALKRSHPDVLHVFYGLSGAAIPLRLDVPVVLTLCGSDVLWWKIGRRPKGLLEYLVSIYTAWRAELILAQSAVVRDAIPRGMRSKVRIQPIGIDYDRFRPMDRSDCRRRLGWDEEETTVLFPAAPTRRSLKRWELASQVVEALQSRHGVHASLKFLMNVDPSDVPLYLNAADCVLVTSAWEAGPVVLTESLACGVPVVSVPVGYAAEMKQPMDLLYVAQPDPASLASTLAAVLRHPPRHERSPVNPTITSSDYAKYLVDAYCSAVDRVRRT